MRDTFEIVLKLTLLAAIFFVISAACWAVELEIAMYIALILGGFCIWVGFIVLPAVYAFIGVYVVVANFSLDTWYRIKYGPSRRHRAKKKK